MQATKLIEELQSLVDKYGDLPVTFQTSNGAIDAVGCLIPWREQPDDAPKEIVLETD